MPRLLLLRHAKAVPQGGLADEHRPLADRGRTDTLLVAEFAAAHGLVPDLVLVSPALRTRETWEFFAPAFATPPTPRIEPNLYSAPAERILHLLRETPANAKALMLVGHNPGLEDLTRILVGSGETDALIRFGGSMSTASLAAIALPGAWPRIEPRTGKLEFFVTPKSLGSDGD